MPWLEIIMLTWKFKTHTSDVSHGDFISDAYVQYAGKSH